MYICLCITWAYMLSWLSTECILRALWLQKWKREWKVKVGIYQIFKNDMAFHAIVTEM